MISKVENVNWLNYYEWSCHNFGVDSQNLLSWSQFLTDFHIWGTKSKLRTCSTKCIHSHWAHLSIKGQNRHRNCRGRQKSKTLFVRVYISWTFKWWQHCLIFFHNGAWWIEFLNRCNFVFFSKAFGLCRKQVFSLWPL